MPAVSAPLAVDPSRRPPPRPARWRRVLGRVLGWVAAVVAVVVLVGILTFPTSELVRALVARVTPPTGPFLVFRAAVLRPWGLRLEQAALRRPDGSAIVEAEWVRVRPSLRGLLRNGMGQPWQIAAAFCGGTLDASVSADQTAMSVIAAWQDLDIAACLPRDLGLTLAGRTSDTTDARAGTNVRPTGHGEVRVRDGLWEREESEEETGLDALHADEVALRWTAAEDRLTLEGFELRGPELELRGGGTVRLTGAPANYGLDLRFVAVPGPDIPEVMQRLLDRLPRAPGADPVARTLVVKGTANEPQVVTVTR